jgi:hypothetical protein
MLDAEVAFRGNISEIPLFMQQCYEYGDINTLIKLLKLVTARLDTLDPDENNGEYIAMLHLKDAVVETKNILEKEIFDLEVHISSGSA